MVRAASDKTIPSKLDLIEYYRDTYGEEKERGTEEWKRHMIDDLFKLEKEGNPGAKRTSIARNFQGDRLEKAARRGSHVSNLLEELAGKEGQIEYSAPSEGYTFEFEGDIQISKDYFHRSFTVHIGDEFAEALAQDTDDYDIGFRVYFQDSLEGPGTASGYRGNPYADVYKS
jgi:hypothetical protein